MRKKPENNSKKTPNFFWEAAAGQRAPASIEVTVFFAAKFTANAVGGIRTLDSSLACLLLYHCTTLSLVSRIRYLSSYIILNRE